MIEVGENALARVAAWPLSAVDGLRSEDVVREIASRAENEQALAGEAATLAAELSRIVPLVARKRDRATVLDLKRAVYRDISPIVNLAQAADLLAPVEPALTTRLAAHQEARLELKRQTDRIQSLYAQARECERRALHEVAGSDAFGRALAIGAPDLFDRYMHDRALDRAGVRARERRRELAILDHLLRAVGRPAPAGLWAGVVPVVAASDENAAKATGSRGRDAGGTVDGPITFRAARVSVADAEPAVLVAVDLRLWLEVARIWRSKTPNRPTSSRTADRRTDVWSTLAAFDSEIDESHRPAWREARHAARTACEALATRIVDGTPEDVSVGRQAVEAITEKLRAAAELDTCPRGSVVRVDMRLPFEVRWNQCVRSRQAAALKAIIRLHAIDGGAELMTRAKRASLGLLSTRRVPLLHATRNAVIAATQARAESHLDRVSAFDGFGDEKVAAAARAIADAWEITLEPVQAHRSVDLNSVAGLCLALATQGTVPSGAGPGPVGSILCEFTADDRTLYLAPRPEPLTFAARYGPLVPGPVVQTRKWFYEWSDEGVEAIDVVAADPLNPTVALVGPVADAAVDASSFSDLKAWTLGRDSEGRPWLFDTTGTPHVALAHHASVFGAFDNASALLRLISTGFGWEMPACLFPILPVERSRWRHLPMLTLGDDVIVSRERWFLDVEILAEIRAVNDPLDRMSRWCSLVKRLGLPGTVTVRASGSPNEAGRMILTDSILGVESFLSGFDDASTQLVFEAGPSSCDGLLMPDGQRHAAQLVISWRDLDHWTEHPPPTPVTPTLAAGWTQLNLRFAIAKRGPLIPWDELDRLFTSLLDGGVIRRWFFVRKPPGLRVRFEIADSLRFDEVIDNWGLATLRSDKSHLIAAHRAVYEPESARMGGPQGLELFHEILCATMPIATRIEQANVDHGARYPLAALGAQWLIEQALSDDDEVTDVWRRLGKLFDGTGAGPDAATRHALTDPVGFSAGLPAGLSTLASELIQLARNFGSRASQLATSGALAVGLRAWVADTVLFQWNTYGLGLDPAAMAAMVQSGIDHLETRAVSRRPG